VTVVVACPRCGFEREILTEAIRRGPGWIGCPRCRERGVAEPVPIAPPDGESKEEAA
jgi:hypothetical protein